MTATRPRAIFLLALLLPLAGCAQAPGDPSATPAAGADDGPRPDPATLQAPRWLPGDHWAYRSAQGAWRNLTVEAEDLYGGRRAYRVEGVTWPPDAFGTATAKLWFAQDSLGLMAIQNRVGTVEFAPAQDALFPLANKTLDYALQTSTGYREEHHANMTVLGWTTLDTGAGRLGAVHVRIDDPGAGTAAAHWFSPQVMNRAAFSQDGELFQLQSWGRRPPGSATR